jgi:hypothetical protein
MRERAHLAGGWMTSGPDGEQYRVTVFIPFGTRTADADAAAAGAEPDLVPAGSTAARPGMPLAEAGDRG